MSSDFHFLVPESFRTKFGSDHTVVSEKIQFEIFYVHDRRPRSRNDLDLQYSHIFIQEYSIRCLFPLTGHWLKQFLKNPIFSLFPIEKP